MTGTPMAFSNRSSAASGSGADADRTNRSAVGGEAGGSIARIEMIAGTALIQVIRSAVIRSQNPRLLNLRSTARYAPARSVPSSPTTSALTWNSGSEQYPRSARLSRCQPATLAAT
jgi:hypothetical protein